jgi:hypothetical protein
VVSLDELKVDNGNSARFDDELSLLVDAYSSVAFELSALSESYSSSSSKSFESSESSDSSE